MKTKKNAQPLYLTRVEERIMQIIWDKERAFVREMLESMPDPKPAQTTVSTTVQILERKGFLGHEKFGKTHRYFPLVSQAEYLSSSLKKMSKAYFQNSYANIVNFFAEDGKLKQKDIEEIEQLLQTLKKKKGKK